MKQASTSPSTNRSITLINIPLPTPPTSLKHTQTHTHTHTHPPKIMQRDNNGKKLAGQKENYFHKHRIRFRNLGLLFYPIFSKPKKIVQKTTFKFSTFPQSIRLHFFEKKFRVQSLKPRRQNSMHKDNFFSSKSKTRRATKLVKSITMQ